MKFPITSDLEQKARFLQLAGNITRIRIFCLLYKQKAACVSDIAASLETTVPNISQHLNLLKDNGLCKRERVGNTVCYRLVKSDFTKYLKKIIC